MSRFPAPDHVRTSYVFEVADVSTTLSLYHVPLQDSHQRYWFQVSFHFHEMKKSIWGICKSTSTQIDWTKRSSYRSVLICSRTKTAHTPTPSLPAIPIIHIKRHLLPPVMIVTHMLKYCHQCIRHSPVSQRHVSAFDIVDIDHSLAGDA